VVEKAEAMTVDAAGEGRGKEEGKVAEENREEEAVE
jgi:hypothetical protein